jgi:Protein of unknown function DUF262
MIEIQAQLDSQRHLVDVDHFDITVRELMRMAAESELITAPEYQRKFRWPESDESRLVESLFLGLPVPSLFVATNADGTWEVVDGLQRLSTLMHFVAEPLSLLSTIHKDAPLRLGGLEKLSSINDRTFEQLPTPLRLAFFKRSLRVTALSDKSDVHVRFDLFERLNTGGVALSPQEVRACILRGNFNDFLRDLAGNDDFRSLVKLQRSKQFDGTKEELVLKAFAYLNNREAFKGAVGEFLTDYMTTASEHFDYESNRALFETAISQLAAVCGGPFLRKGYSNTPLNEFEAVLVAAMELVGEGTLIADPPKGWQNDAKLVNTSTAGTNTLPMLKARIKRAKELLSSA